MTCEGCAGKIVVALKQLDGVSNVEIDVANGTVSVIGDAVNVDTVKEVIARCGFTVVEKKSSCCCGCS